MDRWMDEGIDEWMDSISLSYSIFILLELELSHVDDFIDKLLHEDRVCDVILPRIQVRWLSHDQYSNNNTVYFSEETYFRRNGTTRTESK